VILVVAERILDLQSAMDAFVSGAKAMVPALMILVLAWSIGDICERLGTATVVVDAATGNLSAHFVPTVIFIVAAFLGFSTGTSWGTMAILMPIAIPLAHHLPGSAGLDPAVANSILVASVASVLSGSVLGDHCSPISDTTIMSSMASGSDHVDHVRTQLPYAGLAGVVAVLFGAIPSGFGISTWITLPLGVAVLGLVVRYVGHADRGRPMPVEGESA
jgi:Na+/H+ antiporter NhaC